MVKAGDLGNHDEARKMKVGGHNIINQPAFQGVVKSTFVGEWKQDFPSSGGCGNIGEGVHESEPHMGKEAAAPSFIKKVQIVQGGEEVPPNGGTVHSQNAPVEPFFSEI